MCMHFTFKRAWFPCSAMKHCSISEVQSKHNHKLSLDTHSHICVTHLNLAEYTPASSIILCKQRELKWLSFAPLQQCSVICGLCECVSSSRAFRVCSLAIFHSRLKRTEKLWDFSEVKYVRKLGGATQDEVDAHVWRYDPYVSALSRVRVVHLCLRVWRCVAHAWHGLVSAWAPCTRWTLSWGLLLAVVSHQIWWSRPTYSPMLRWFSTHLTLLYQHLLSPSLSPYLSLSLTPLENSGYHLLFFTEKRFSPGAEKKLYFRPNSPPALSALPLQPFYPLFTRFETIPPPFLLKRIAASLLLPSFPSFPLMRIHNLSPVAWTPIPQCGCLIGFGCGCTSGTRLQVVSSWPRAAWAVLDPEGWEWAE